MRKYHPPLSLGMGRGLPQYGSRIPLGCCSLEQAYPRTPRRQLLSFRGSQRAKVSLLKLMNPLFAIIPVKSQTVEKIFPEGRGIQATVDP